MVQKNARPKSDTPSRVSPDPDPSNLEGSDAPPEDLGATQPSVGDLDPAGAAISIPGEPFALISLHIPLATYMKYNIEGMAEQEILHRLAQCATHTARKPLYFTDEERRQIEKLLAKNFSSPSEVITAIKHLTTVEIDGVEVRIDPKILKRLHSRHSRRPLPEVIEQLINQALRTEVGM